MSNPGNDNRLEQLSREAASGYTPPGNASWEKMEAALDQVMPVKEKRKRRVIFWWLFPLTIIGAGLAYFVWPGAVPPPTSSSTISAVAPAPAATTTKTLPPSTTTEKSLPTPATITNSIPIQNKEAQPTVNSHPKTGSGGIQPVTVAASTNKKITQITADQQQQANQQLNQQDLAATGEQDRKITDAVTKNNTTNNIPVYTIQPTVDSGSSKTVNSIIEKTDTHHQPVIADSLQTDSSKTKTEKTTNSKFSLAFVAGMDASTVKYKYSDKAGINIGILGGYHFNEHWSIHTGVLFTKKNYTVAGEDFTAPKGSWVANYKLSMVDGYCNMWEVPLLARYQFNGNNRQRNFFVSAGISSYFMTRENYNYSYYWNGQPVTRNNNYPDGNTHLLSILRLSGGWSKAIGSGTSLLVEPYAALPLGGVGYGSIRLSSFGLNFSLQLKQPSKKK